MEKVRIYNVRDYITSNYNSKTSLYKLEEISCYSYRNLQRIFKYTFDETIGAFQQRLKIENGYKKLLFTNDKLKQIALDVGFESLAAFSKAFKVKFKLTPSVARKKKINLLEEFNIKEPLNVQSIISPKIEYFHPLKVYYRSRTTSYNLSELDILWNELNAFYNDTPQQMAYFGVIADEPLITKEILCRYDACCTEQSTTKKLPSKIILGGKYAVFTHFGKYDLIDLTYKEIYSKWIFQSDLEFDHTPIIEQYIKHSENTSCENDYVTKILIPLKK